MQITCDFLVVGAGIVGLTVANELKKRHPSSSIVILEKENDVAKHASGRNSGVMHSGVYYGNTTLKAQFCSSGAALMRTFAEKHQIPCQKVGKVIIATSKKDLPVIEKLLKNAKDNGVRAERLDEKGVKEIEPYASPYEAGIFSPDTSIIDSKAVVYKLRSILQSKGVQFFFNAPITKVVINQKAVHTPSNVISYSYLYNCAGAGADLVAKKFGFSESYTLIPFKGIYYKIKSSKKYLVQGNIYPVPDVAKPFLGVHLSKVISGDIYVGPTAIPAFGRENYGVIKGIEFIEGMSICKNLLAMYLRNKQNFRKLVHTEFKKYLKPMFLDSAKKLVNSLSLEDLEMSDKVGIRPQLINTKTRSLEMDFIIESDHSSMHILNSISPAFTCSFAFSKFIVDQAERK